MVTERGTQQQGNFFALREESPFSINKMPISDKNIFSSKNWSWLKELDPETLIKLRSVRSEVYRLLGVKSFSEIKTLINNPDKREEVKRRAYVLLGGTYGIEGTEKEVSSKIEDYAKTADEVISYLKNGALSHYASQLEMINEVTVENNPIDLLLITFDEKYANRARFEAKRKLILMGLAASIDQRGNETKTDQKFAAFLDFLNQEVWSKDAKIGEVESICILSRHDPDTFACISYDSLKPEEASKIKLNENEKLTLLDRRTFTTDGGRKIPIYVTTRNKSPVLKILKLLRKGVENPAVAVDDELGLLGVLSSEQEIDQFQKQLGKSATRAGSLMKFEEISDTLRGGRYNGANIGSSPNVRMRKFFIKLGGMRVEFILHTSSSYLDYLFRDGISHEEYEVRRLVDSEVTKLLFPGVDIDKQLIIHQVRRKIRQG